MNFDTTATVTLTDKQYRILLDLYHEMNEVFHTLPGNVRHAFLERLHNGL